MAPEVMCRQNHGVAVDYFALGVMGYEFMMGKRPYVGKSRKEIRDAIFAKQVQLKKADIPDGWTLESADFINKCLQRKPANRLGLNGPNEVKGHVWLKDFDWQCLLDKKMEAEYFPQKKDDNFDDKQANGVDKWKEENAELLKDNANLLRRDSIQNLFAGYYFDRDC
jgi:protein kinase A